MAFKKSREKSMLALKGDTVEYTSFDKRDPWQVRYNKTHFLSYSLISLAFLLITTTGSAQAPTDTVTYIVKKGDTLSNISQRFGNKNFWKSIFDGNRDLILDPNVIYPGQVLRIPSSISLPELKKASTQEEQKKPSNTSSGADADSMEVQNPTSMEEKFREAFKEVVAQEEKEEEGELATNVLELGGLVINKTKTKMGSEFFYAFNDNWKHPEEAGNFMLEITEQPSPSMGTIIVVRVDNRVVFKTRLSPRMASLEKAVNYSIAKCYQYMNQQISSSTKINIY